MAEIKVTRTWNSDYVRSMCIKYDYYGCGTCDQYNDMLELVDKVEPTPYNVYLVADDILKHSGLEGMEVEAMMFNIDRECIRTYYEFDYEL